MANKKTKSPMAVDKSATPAWMKVVIIAIVISFAAGGVAIVAAGIGGGGTPAGSTAGGDAINARFEPRANAAVTTADANPDKPEIVAQAGHAYYEWAVALYEAGRQADATPFWYNAVAYYDKVLALTPDDDIVLGNKAFALYYAQSPDAAEALEAFVDGASDNAGLAAQVENARSMLDGLQAAPESTGTP